MSEFFCTGCRGGPWAPPPPYSDYRDRPFDYAAFVAAFPEFADTSLFPQTVVEIAGKTARLYVTDCPSIQMDGPDRAYAQNLMAAHLAVLAVKRSANPTGAPSSEPGGAGGGSGTSSIGTGSGVGMITSASVGGVSVSMQLPQSASSWEYWLNQTPYGQELLAYLSAHVPAGIYGYGEDLRVLRW